MPEEDENEEQELDEEDNEDEEEEEEEGDEAEEWSEARTIFGKLVGIDKKQQNLSIEYKTGNGDWQTETFSTEDFTNDEYEGLRRSLGDDITVNVVDHTIDSWEASE